jgi:hypothetical protein
MRFLKITRDQFAFPTPSCMTRTEFLKIFGGIGRADIIFRRKVLHYAILAEITRSISNTLLGGLL